MPVHVETLQKPTLYTPTQIDKAIAIAAQLQRGKLIVVEPPAGPAGGCDSDRDKT